MCLLKQNISLTYMLSYLDEIYEIHFPSILNCHIGLLVVISMYCPFKGRTTVQTISKGPQMWKRSQDVIVVRVRSAYGPLIKGQCLNQGTVLRSRDNLDLQTPFGMEGRY